MQAGEDMVDVDCGSGQKRDLSGVLYQGLEYQVKLKGFAGTSTAVVLGKYWLVLRASVNRLQASTEKLKPIVKVCRCGRNGLIAQI